MPRALLPVLLAVFLDLLGFGLVIPLLTFYAEDFGATALQVTLLMACYSVAQFLFTPVWGALSDRVGRRPVLLGSIFMTAAMLAGFASASSLVMLFVFRTLHGASTANISTAQAAVADLTTPENRAKGMGLIGAAFGVGFSLGPWMGGELADLGHGYALPIWVAAGLSAINFVLAVFFFPETRKAGAAAAPAHRERTINPARMLRALMHPVVGLSVLLTFVVTVAFALMESTFTLFAEHVRDLSASGVGRMFGVAGVVTILIQGGLIGRLVKRFGEARLVPVGIALLALGLALLPLAPPVAAMVGVFCLIAVGQGITTPSLQSLVSRGVSEDEQGFVLGANQSMSALARAIGPAIGGAIYMGISPSAPFWFSALLLVGGLGLSLAALRQQRRAASGSPPG